MKEEVKTKELEEIYNILFNKKGIDNLNYGTRDEYGYTREITFEVFGIKYSIKRWINLIELITEHFQLNFIELDVRGTWPNHAKNNIQFYDDRKDCIFILPIEY